MILGNFSEYDPATTSHYYLMSMMILSKLEIGSIEFYLAAEIFKYLKAKNMLNDRAMVTFSKLKRKYINDESFALSFDDVHIITIKKLEGKTTIIRNWE